MNTGKWIFGSICNSCILIVPALNISLGTDCSDFFVPSQSFQAYSCVVHQIRPRTPFHVDFCPRFTLHRVIKLGPAYSCSCWLARAVRSHCSWVTGQACTREDLMASGDEVLITSASFIVMRSLLKKRKVAENVDGGWHPFLEVVIDIAEVIFCATWESKTCTSGHSVGCRIQISTHLSI
jgi:hypothetical protein